MRNILVQSGSIVSLRVAKSLSGLRNLRGDPNSALQSLDLTDATGHSDRSGYIGRTVHTGRVGRTGFSGGIGGGIGGIGVVSGVAELSCAFRRSPGRASELPGVLRSSPEDLERAGAWT